MDEEITKYLQLLQNKRIYPQLPELKPFVPEKTKLPSLPPRILASRRVKVPVIAHALAKTSTTRGCSNSNITPSTTPKSGAGKQKKVRKNDSTPKYLQVDAMSDDGDDDISTVSRRSTISHGSFLPFPAIRGTSQGMMPAPQGAPSGLSQRSTQIAPQLAPAAQQYDMMQMMQMFQEAMSRDLRAILTQSIQPAQVAPVVMPTPVMPIYGHATTSQPAQVAPVVTPQFVQQSAQVNFVLIMSYYIIKLLLCGFLFSRMG